MGSFVDVRREERAGVPVYWAAGPGPFAAGVVFRVGRVDETLASAGATHLVEHLAIPPDPGPVLEVNGQIDATTATLWAAGEREASLATLARVCATLAALPADRLETERSVLLTEGGSPVPHPIFIAAVLRFGHRGLGLLALPELGLHRLDAAAVQAWSDERFTAGNAGVWMTGKPPKRLELPLAAGERLPLSEPRPIPEVVYPSVAAGPGGVVAVGSLVRRSHAALALLAVAERRARRALRHERGLTYEIDSHYEPLTRDVAHVTFWADCLDENADAVRDGLVSGFERLGDEGPTEKELAAHADEFEAWARDPSGTPAVLVQAVVRELFGEAEQPPAEAVARRRAVTGEEVAATARDFLDGALLLVPGEAPPGHGRFSAYPVASTRRVEGRRHRLRGPGIDRASRRTALVVGEAGVTREFADGGAATVAFDDCVALQRWHDGSRALWSGDGFVVEVDPIAWRGGREAVVAIDTRVPEAVVVPMDRELEERAARVEDALGDKLRPTFMTSSELAGLPRHLARGETVLAAAQARRSWRGGVLAVTDRRLLFLFLDDLVVEVPRAAITSVEASPGSWVRESRLVVEAGERLVFKSVKPRERLEEVARVLAEPVGA